MKDLLDRAARELRGNEARVLMYLIAHPTAKGKEVAEALDLQPSNVSRAIKRISDKGYNREQLLSPEVITSDNKVIMSDNKLSSAAIKLSPATTFGPHKSISVSSFDNTLNNIFLREQEACQTELNDNMPRLIEAWPGKVALFAVAAPLTDAYVQWSNQHPCSGSEFIDMLIEDIEKRKCGWPKYQPTFLNYITQAKWCDRIVQTDEDKQRQEDELYEHLQRKRG